MTSSDETDGNDPLQDVEWVRDQIMRECEADAAGIERWGRRDAVDAMESAYHLRDTLHPSLRRPLVEWWKSGRFDPKLAVEGWTIQRLIDQGVTTCVYGAFTWLSGLITDPQATLEYIHEPRHRIIVPEEMKQAGLAAIKKKAN